MFSTDKYLKHHDMYHTVFLEKSTYAAFHWGRKLVFPNSYKFRKDHMTNM